jgi:hypothetical protein
VTLSLSDAHRKMSAHSVVVQDMAPSKNAGLVPAKALHTFVNVSPCVNQHSTNTCAHMISQVLLSSS